MAGRANLALPVISLTSVWQWVGMPTVMFMAGLMGISEELLEAARIDGASEWSIFWKIKVPLLKPVIGIVAILTFVDNFNAFDVIYAMAGAKGEPAYSTDLLATLFYRTGIAGEHPVGIPNMGMGATIATMTFIILMAGVLIWLYFSRRQETDQSLIGASHESQTISPNSDLYSSDRLVRDRSVPDLDPGHQFVQTPKRDLPRPVWFTKTFHTRWL